jgi:hypothetical protein
MEIHLKIINIGKLGMSFRNNLLSMVFLPSLLLVGCGGGGEFNIGGGDGNLAGGGSSEGGGGSEGGGDETNTSTVSYLPLSVHVEYSDYVAGLDENDVFISERSFPDIRGYFINPVDSRTLAPVDTATVDDYRMKVNDIEIDPTESFPILQKVIGNSVYLRTALVFDATGSTSQVDLDALKSEAKSYVAKAQAHANPIIANQSFVIWSFGQDNPAIEDVTDLSGGFETNIVNIESAIDNVMRYQSSSNLHKAVVKVIGGYVDTAATPPIDYASDGNNELRDVITSNGIILSQIVIFSSGPDTKGEFAKNQMVESIQSQGLLKYESAGDGTTAATNNFTSKPVFYYVVGATVPGTPYTELSEVSEKTTSLTLTNGNYSFGDTLILDQISAINSRIDLDNQHIYRYAFLPRQGLNTRLFESRSIGFNYSLTGDTQFAAPESVGTPYFELESSVEITGPNGEYISGAVTGGLGEYITGGLASLSEVNVFRPVTRWTNNTYQSTDYTWTLTSGVGVTNADGSYTVNSITGASATLRVDNTVNGQFAFITINN